MELITYFNEERIQNLFCIILGSISIALALIFLGIIKYSFYKGMAIPLLLFGVLQLITGTSAFSQTTKELARVQQIIDQEPETSTSPVTKTGELLRMKSVLQHFQVYQWIEIVLILAGLFLYLKFYRSSTLTFWKGMGLGLLLQASIILSLDTIAEHRSEKYVQFLQSV